MKNALWIGLLSCLLAGCELKTTLPSELTLVPSPTAAAGLLVPSTTPVTPLPAPGNSPQPASGDSGWVPVDAGLERRRIDLTVDGQVVDHLALLRIYPAFFHFEIAYDPVHPKSLADWQRQLGARIVFNGGFFRVAGQRYLPAGLLVVDGQASGETYSGYGGMFVVTARGPELRWLVQQPYDPGEPLRYALQSFPMLVKPGGVLGFPAEREDNMLARRTVLGEDRAGRFIVLVTSSSYFTLHRLSAYLVDSDLDLDVALNLDGGPSTGLELSDPPLSLPAASYLPIVIAVFPN